MYLNDEKVMESFYKVTKAFVDKANNESDEFDNDFFSLANRIEGMVALVDELLKVAE